MQDGIRKDIFGGSPAQVVLGFRIQGNANSDPTSWEGALQVDSVSRTAPGRYTVTLKQTCPQLEAVVAHVQDTTYATTATHKRAKCITHDVASAKTLTFVVTDGPWKTDEYTDAIASATDGLLDATATTVAVQTVLAAALKAAGKNELAARPRNVTFTTSGGTPADAPATATITGTDINGDALTEEVNVPQTATTAEGVKAFKTITSIVYSAGQGTDALVAIGFGKKFGLSRKAKTRASAVNKGTEISAGSYVTNGTLVVAETGLPNGTYSPNANPDGSADFAITYETDGDADLASTEWLHVDLILRNTSLGV